MKADIGARIEIDGRVLPSGSQVQGPRSWKPLPDSSPEMRISAWIQNRILPGATYECV